jgi:MFS family permease
MGRLVTAAREAWEQTRTSLREVFGTPNLRRVQLAFGVQLLGYWAFGVALGIYAFRANGAAGVGLAALVRLLPGAFAAPFAGTIADRYDRRLVMIAGDASRAVVVLAAAALVAAGAPYVLVLALAGVNGVIQTVHRPATSAIMPTLVRSPEQLTAANAVASTVESTSMLAGPAVGGVLVAVASVQAVFVVTAAGLLASAVLVSRIVPVAAPERTDEPPPPQGILRASLEGFRTIVAEPRVRLLIGLISAQTLVAGALNVLVVVMALQLFHAGDAAVGYLNAAVGLGGVAGGMAALGVASKRLAPSFAAGLLLWGLPLLLIAAVPDQAVAIVVLALVGLGNTLVDVSGLTLLQRAVRDEVLARVFGVLESMVVLTIAVAGALTPLLISALGIRGALVATGLFLPVIVALTWNALHRVDVESQAPAPREVELLRGLPIFAPLPMPALERLAAHLQPVRVPAGATVFAQGAEGDRFFVVAEGEVEVSRDGTVLDRRVPGEGFGEIALLRDVPRTAGVKATADTLLYALDRQEFVPVVTGHAASREQADAVIAARLPQARAGLASV